MTSTELRGWLIERVAQEVRCEPGAIDCDAPFESFGMDSTVILGVSGELEELLGLELSPTVLFEHSTIARLAAALGQGAPSAMPSLTRATGVDDVAVIGMSCRFPGAISIAEFRRVLQSGTDCMRPVPEDRWPMERLYDPSGSRGGTIVTRLGGFIDRPDYFDARFFGISRAEAERMDPQQRLLLQVTWEALEDACISDPALRGSRGGVFVGIASSDYGRSQTLNRAEIDGYVATGNALSVAANRLSYFLDLNGPSLAVDTACSSSLVALHLACESLRRGECDFAIVGGVNLMLTPDLSVSFSSAGMLAPDGRCKTFDARADGYSRGEGCGVVVLKALPRAVADGDPVHAIVRGSAINHCGRTNGLTAPSPQGQRRVLEEAYRNGRVDPNDVGYVELHGTGTFLGDPIEAEALGAVLGRGGQSLRPLHVGSVKTNIGHLEAAAGIAGFIKAVLCVEDGYLVPSLNYSEPNPHIPLDRYGMAVARKFESWPTEFGRRVAGVSSFGFGGANAHVIVEALGPASERDAAAQQDDSNADAPWLLPLSARSEDALRAAAGRYRTWIEERGERVAIGDVCVSAGLSRSQHPLRVAVVGHSSKDLCTRLAAIADSQTPSGVVQGAMRDAKRTLTFVFSGQGSQWFGMGQQLLASEPAFASAARRCDDALARHLGYSMIDVLSDKRESERSRFSRTDFAQPAIFLVSVALAELWKARGVAPDAVLGHSVGEVAAACVAGILTLEEAAALVCERGRIMQQAAGSGRMLAVGVERGRAEGIAAASGHEIAVAAVNSLRSSVLSGNATKLEEIRRGLVAEGAFASWVLVDFPFHSKEMNRLRDPLCQSLAGLRPKPAQISFISTALGKECEGEVLGPGYWADAICSPVLLSDAVATALGRGSRIFLEVGPHSVLTRALNEDLSERGADGAVAVASLRKGEERTALVEAQAALYVQGISPRWTECLPDARRLHGLPSYAWQEQRYRREVSAEDRSLSHASRVEHPLLGTSRELADRAGEQLWTNWLSVELQPWLSEHRAFGVVLLPATAFFEMARAAAERGGLRLPCVLEDLSITAPLMLEEKPREVQTRVLPGSRGGWDVFVYSRAGSDPWTLHARASVANDVTLAPQALDPDAVRVRCLEQFQDGQYYQLLRGIGLDYGPSFQGLRGIVRGGSEALARVVAPAGLEVSSGEFVLHPALLDAALHAVAATDRRFGTDDAEGVRALLPSRLARMRLYEAPRWPGLVRVLRRPSDTEEHVTVDLTLAHANGSVFAEIEGLELHRARGRALHAHSSSHTTHDAHLYEIRWVEDGVPAQGGELGTVDWVVLGRARGLDRELLSELERRGHRAALVEGIGAGRSATRVKDDLLALLESAPRDRRQAVVHVAACDEPVDAGSSEAQSALLGSVVDALRAMTDVAHANPPRLSIVTRNVQRIDGFARGSLDLSGAMLWGLGAVIAVEHPELGCRRIDLDPADARATQRLADELEREGDEDQIVLRDERRFLARMLASRTQASGRSGSLVQSDVSYLVTGAFGALGRVAIRWLVQRGARQLILISRKPGEMEAAELGAELEAAGVRALIAGVDAADEQQMAALLEEAAATLPRIAGVIHLAGVLRDRRAVELTVEDFSYASRPKAAGAWNLHRMLPSDLDFFVLFSSAAAVLGSPGQGNYAAANRFMHALAEERARAGRCALSVEWGPWADVGMAAAAAEESRLVSAVTALAPDTAMAVMERLLEARVPHATVLGFELQDLLRFYPAGASLAFFTDLLGQETRALGVAMEGDASERPDLDQEYVAPRNAVERRIAAIWQRALGLRGIGVRDSFFELGGDSVFGTQIIVQVNRAFGTSLDSVEVFEEFTIEKIATMVEQALVRAAADLSDEEVARLLASHEEER